MTRGIPIALYGDAVPSCKDQSFLSMSWESLTVGDDTRPRDRIQYIGGYYVHTDVTNAGAATTSQCWWPPVVSSLLNAEAGVFPDDDLGRGGQEVAGGYYLVVMAVKGDYEFKMNYMGLPGHWSSAYPCCDCLATLAEGPMNFRNTKHDAPWKERTFAKLGHAEWVAHCGRLGKVPALPFQPRGRGGLGLTHHFNFQDMLHCWDLGITQHILGNTLWHLVFTDVMGPGSAKHKFDEVATMINDEYRKRDTSSQFTNLDMAMFCDCEHPQATFPYLKGKAGNTRHLAPILRDIWCKVASKEVAYEQHICRVLTNLCVVYASVGERDASGDRYFTYPVAVSDAIISAIDKLCLHYAFLCKTCADMSPARLLWNMPPKFHHGLHSGQQSRWATFRSTWTYNNEDFMAHVQVLGEAHRHSLKAAHRSAKMAECYLLGRSLRMHITAL